jgi:hypothetical protein
MPTRATSSPTPGPEQIKSKLEVLAEHCVREGADFERIRKTILWTGGLDATAAGGEAFAEQMRAYAAVGIGEVHVMPFTPDPVEFIGGLGEHVVGRLDDIR